MILLCGINSEEYGDCMTYFCKDTDAAKDIISRRYDSKNYSMEWEDNRCTITDLNNPYDWRVYQYFEVSSDIVLVHYHAYEGVDFDVVGEFDDFNKARDKMTLAAFEVYSNAGENHRIFDWIYGDSACVDTGNEWQLWYIATNLRRTKNG